MSRLARHQVCPECPPAPPLYHVTNRGADRRDVFRNALDMLSFLSMLALACSEDGLRVHAFCLMTNHFHLLLEDPRGMLSRAMGRTTGTYARLFNDSRGSRGTGHVFGDRFHCQLVDSAVYYDRLVSYILLNPARCEPPLAEDTFAYLGSSAALHERDTSVGDYFRELIERAGGRDALLAAMPEPSHPSVTANRKKRLDALCSDDWMDPLAARCGRTAGELRQVLDERRGMCRPSYEDPEGPGPAGAPEPQRRGPNRARRRAARRGRTTLPLPIASAPRVTERFPGWPIEIAADLIREGLAAWMPEGYASAPELLCSLFWRFTSAPEEAIARALGLDEPAVETSVETVRGLRRGSPAWARQLRALEWRVGWLLRAGPCRA